KILIADAQNCGSKANMTITGASEGSSANHGGGSCQISLSTDGAKTFTVLQSIIGNCPTSGTSNLDFSIPADAPTGNHVLAWTWHNQIGNREMYMNCASVTLTSSSGGAEVKKMARAAAYASRPGIFIANVGSAGDGCKTEESFDVVYPRPGPDVVNDSSKPKAPTCGVTQQVTTGGSGGIFSPDSGAGADTGSNNQPTRSCRDFALSYRTASNHIGNIGQASDYSLTITSNSNSTSATTSFGGVVQHQKSVRCQQLRQRYGTNNNIVVKFPRRQVCR
ncbi:hypothetical protein N0V82_010627, partial [Gnomoniopsis sp. IMI 355080]